MLLGVVCAAVLALEVIYATLPGIADGSRRVAAIAARSHSAPVHVVRSSSRPQLDELR